MHLTLANATVAEATEYAEEGLYLKAKAFEEYGQAATVKLVLDKLPEIATEVARPLAKIDDIVWGYAKTGYKTVNGIHKSILHSLDFI